MRTLALAVFLAVVFVQNAFAQTSQTTVTQQPAAAQAPEKAPPQPEPPTSSQQNSQTNKERQPASQVPDQFRFNLVPPKTPPSDKKLPTGTIDRGFRAFAVPGPHLHLNVNSADLLSGDRQRKLDPGIYAQTNGVAGAGRFCSSILSYNFSQTAPGEMPKLESVTTCTPSETVVPRRAQGHDAKPSAPQLQRTGFVPL